MISEGRTPRYAWYQDGTTIKLSFDPVGKIEAVCRVDFPPNQALTGDEELFTDFDTERVASALIVEMMKVALLHQRIMMLDAVRDAAEIQGLERKLVILLGNDRVTGTLAREKKTVKLFYLRREGPKIMRVPMLKSTFSHRDYGAD
jgi:hypothetical protein